MKRWKFTLAFVAVFVAGGITGGVIAMRFVPPPFGSFPDAAEKMTERIMGKLKSELDLRPDQEEKIKPVVARTTEQTVGFHRELSARIHAAIEASDLEIEAFLDADQKAKFEKLRAKRPHHLNGP